MLKRKVSPFFKIIYLIVWVLLKLLFRIKILGEEVPKEGGVIIAANHRSYIDPLVIGLCCKRPIHFVGKEELFSIPLLSWLLRLTDTIPIKRGKPDMKSLRRIIDLIREGRLIGIFPEGTRRRKTADEEAVAFRGVGLISQKTGAPIYPISISGTDKVFVGGILPVRLPRITAVVGKPISSEGEFGKELQIDISKRTMEAIEKNLRT